MLESSPSNGEYSSCNPNLALGWILRWARSLSKSSQRNVLLTLSCLSEFRSVCALRKFKAFAGRSQDWRDIEMTIVRQSDGGLDWTYIRAQLMPLLELKEQPESFDQLQALRTRLRRNPPSVP